MDMFETNDKTFEQQAKDAAAGLVNILTAITPIFLVAAILGVATFNGWLEYIHYFAVIGSLAWIPGFVFAAIRFGSGLGGIHMFKGGETMKGLFFLAISVGLTFWTSAHAPAMAESIAIELDQIGNAEWFIHTCLWVALLGELMIATYMSAHKKDAQRATRNRNGATGGNVAGLRDVTNSSATAQRNGNGAIYNSATEQRNEQLQRQQIGFRQRPATSNRNEAATRQNAVSNDVSGDDAYLLQEQLDKARNNLRAYESKLRNGKGNPETLRRGVARWENRVAELEEKLQAV